MERPEQFHLFVNTPETLNEHLKANTIISILGGNKSEEDARVIGHDIAASGFSVKTGGYDMGAMKGGLEGAAVGLSEGGGFSKQKVKGITSADFNPIEAATKGEKITTEVANDPYERLRSLIRDSDILVIIKGSIGTELEIYASFAFEIELDIAKHGKSEKPIIFVGQNLKEKVLSNPKFAAYIEKSENVIFVDSPEEVLSNVEAVFEKIKEKKRKDIGIAI